MAAADPTTSTSKQQGRTMVASTALLASVSLRGLLGMGLAGLAGALALPRAEHWRASPLLLVLVIGRPMGCAVLGAGVAQPIRALRALRSLGLYVTAVSIVLFLLASRLFKPTMPEMPEVELLGWGILGLLCG